MGSVPIFDVQLKASGKPSPQHALHLAVYRIYLAAGVMVNLGDKGGRYAGQGMVGKRDRAAAWPASSPWGCPSGGLLRCIIRSAPSRSRAARLGARGERSAGVEVAGRHGGHEVPPGLLAEGQHGRSGADLPVANADITIC